jgi:CheY-like chemotaxis protein
LTTISPDPGGSGHAEVHLIHDLSETQRMRDALQHTANLALLGRMSASLVHEISQPMNVIRLTAEGSVLKLKRGELDGDALRERFDTIADQAARLFDTIDFMQTFSRLDSAMGIGSKGGPTNPEPMDLARSTREALSVITPALGTVAVSVQGPEEGCWVCGKPRQIEQVLINLLSNALQAVADQPGSRQIRLTLGPTTTQNRPGWQVAVEDSGLGIPHNSRGAIFEPFFTTKPAGQGTGLGLAISLGIARTMGGVIDVGDSPSLGGACLTLWLPAADMPGRGSDASPSLLAPSTSGEGHILLVEDEELARKEMAAALRDLGYRVSTASGGTAAQTLLASAAESRQPVDLVVTDLRMADGDGYSLLAHLEDDYPQVFTIVVTGQPLRDREALAERGVNADDVLRKPVSLDHLGAAVGRLLNGA